MGTNPALSQAQPCETSQPPADENSFRFTPIKALRAIPHLWERKPATPFKSGLKRKLWKRFQPFFTNMQTLESSTALEHDALQTAINTSKDAAYVRGVKRLCVGTGESVEHADGGNVQTRPPFVETKWDSEASRKRRKLPDTPFEVYDETSNATAERTIDKQPAERDDLYELDADGDLAMATASPVPFKSLRSPPKTLVSDDTLSIDNSDKKESNAKPIEQKQEPVLGNGAVQTGNGDVTMTPTKIVRNLTQAQEGTLLRSALRSSLDREDAKVLNDFLSKAMAKRAAKAALGSSHESDTIDKSSSPEESPDSECATPRSRKTLEERNANSPSPVKVRSSPSKEDSMPGDESRENVVSKETQAEQEAAPASPANRRSTRAKAPAADAAPSRNTISLRRAKGTEFVFLQRTDAQELALETRRNTRHNRGSSLMPKYALQAMAQESSSATDSDTQSQADRKSSGSRKTASKARKRVTWNEERMVEYEGDLPTPAPSDEDEAPKHDVDKGRSRARSGTKHAEKKASTSSRSEVPQKAEAETEPTAPATEAVRVSTTSKSRRVRRLGDSAMTSGTPVKTGSGRVSRPPAISATSVAPPAAAAAAAAAGPSTPTKPRRKLVPKSPSSSLLSAPISKASSTGGEQHFVSGIPTRSTTGSEGKKRKSMMEANAGCTPMPRRVRPRS